MVRAYVMIRVGAGEYFSVEKTIKEKNPKMPEVIRVDNISGRFDLIPEAEADEPRMHANVRCAPLQLDAKLFSVRTMKG
jgi:hypothetical protein